MILAEVAQRLFSGDGFDAAHAAGDASLFQNLDESDFAGGRDVRAAAEFGGEIGDLEHAHLFAVLFAEERHGVVLVDGNVDGNVFDGFHAAVAEDLAVGDVLDLLQLFVGDRGEVREVEAQIVRRDQRAGLLDVSSEHLAQRGVEQVGRRVMAARGRCAVRSRRRR